MSIQGKRSRPSGYDLIVIGAGPGGYVCAIRAAQLGLEVACIEKAPRLGGTCLNVGCIPSKALLESSERFESLGRDAAKHGIRVRGATFDLGAMMGRKDAIVRRLTGGVEFLLKKNKITWVQGTARLGGSSEGRRRVIVDGEGGEMALEADAIVIATGSAPAALPGVPFDGETIVSSTEALSFDAVPRRLVVVGAGVIGLELGSVWRRLGSEVRVLEYLDRPLPGMDGEIVDEAAKALAKQGLHFTFGARVHAARVDGGVATLTWDDRDGAAPNTSHQIEAERVLVAIGRRPYTASLGCEEAGVARDRRGRIEIDARWQTSVPGIFAIGDVIKGAMLAHKASDEGIAVAENLAGGVGHVCYDAVPAIVYTHPEVAGLGATEEQLREAATPYAKGTSRYMANGRALALGVADGIVKILAHAETDRILGAHIFGARAGELIAELAVAIELGASAEDIARSVHAHPTLAELVREAALDVGRRAIHK